MSQIPEIGGASSRFLQAGGLRTHYYEMGEGQPLVLLHGGGAGADAYGNWRGCMSRFAGHFHVFAVDMAGFGYSEKPDPARFPYSQAARNAHIAAVIEGLKIAPTHLIGNSMGGATSMGMAVERPELVDRLVLMGSAGVRAPISPELATLMDYDFSVEGMRKIVAGLTNPDFEVNDDIVSYRHALSVDAETGRAYTAVMDWIRTQGGLYYEEDYIRRVAAPCLVVNGKKDLVVPITSAYKLLELIEDSRGYIIPNCGHWAMIEYPEEFARVSLAFLND